VNAKGGIARAAGILGHELRNPLAAAVTGAALLRELTDKDDPRSAIVEGLQGELARMARLIDHCLDFARCGQARREPVSLRALLQTIVRGRPKAQVDAPQDLVVLGDDVLLERALHNLIDNAMAAGAGQVRLSLRQDGGKAQLLVEDDGPGVPPELRARIFEPGFSRSGSTGLGLGFVAEVVAAHQGSVVCENGRAGARFLLTLPCAAMAASA
jgi:signal transduction histidine kinase